MHTELETILTVIWIAMVGVLLYLAYAMASLSGQISHVLSMFG